MRKNLSVALFLPLSILFGCATSPATSVISPEKNIAQGDSPLRSVLVIGIANKPGSRSPFETAFADALKKNGVTAIPAFSIIPSTAPLNRDTLRTTVREQHLDAVLITRLVSEKDMPTFTPSGISAAPEIDSASGSMYSFYENSMRYAYTPGRVTEKQWMILETRIFRAADEKLIWSAQSRTTADISDEAAARSAVAALIDRMRQDGVVP